MGGSGDTECLSIPIINDNDFEGDHSFQAQLMTFEPSSVPAMLDMALATITIQDNDGEICCCNLMRAMLCMCVDVQWVPRISLQNCSQSQNPKRFPMLH